MKKKIDRWINRIINVLCALAILGVVYVLAQVFLFAVFRIPSDSMSPTLIKGDMVMVWKPTVGARLFDIFASMKGQQVEIRRVPGLRKIKRSDVLVFNFPYPQWDNWDKIEMHILQYYIKRCIALPGDTLAIRNGIYEISGSDIVMGNIESQKRIGMLDAERISGDQYQTLPFDSLMQWNIKNFGPMYIPRKGDIIDMDRTNFLLYKRLVEWEQKETLSNTDTGFFLGDSLITTYCFGSNYYFMGGDNGLGSVDSRFWGVVPEEYIVGKAGIILKSNNPETGDMRWDRFMKFIN